MKLRGRLFRHPLFWAAGLFVAGLALWVGHFLATFDLDQYREQIAGELGGQLKMPVHLGAAQMELREAGIAFRFADLRIGTPGSAIELQAEKLWLQLAWHGLLLKKPVLTEVALHAPHLRLTGIDAASVPVATESPAFDFASLRGVRIRRLEIHQGSVVYTPAPANGPPVRLADIEAEIGDFGAGRQTTCRVTGNWGENSNTPARLVLDGRAELPDEGPLARIAWDLDLDARRLDAQHLASLVHNRLGLHAKGTFDLALSLKGAPATGLALAADLTGAGLGVKPAPEKPTFFPINKLRLGGTWQRQEGRADFRKMTLQIDDLQLNGDFSLREDGSGRNFTGQLKESSLPLDHVRYWIPPALLESSPIFSKRRPGGVLDISSAGLHAAAAPDQQGFGGLVLDELQAELKGVSWDLDGQRTIDLHSLGLRLDKEQWFLERGVATVAGLPTTVAATLTPQADGIPRFTLDMKISGPAGTFAALRNAPLPEKLALAGDLALNGHLEGTLAQYRLTLEADLAALEVNYGDQVKLPAQPGNRLTLRGQGTRSALTVEQADLQLAALTGQATGTIDWAADPTLQLSAVLHLPELAAAYPYAPAVGKLQLRGGVAGYVTADGPLAGPKTKIELELTDVAIPAHGFVADISQLKGRLLLNGKSLQGNDLKALLGKSPVSLQARVADLAAPRLELDVQAPSVRADEVIFRSDRIMLRNLDARLLFDQEGLWFKPVKVGLDGGTRATVTGSVKNFDAPRVNLEITGDYAKVEEIIGLWTWESPAAESARRARNAAAPPHRTPPISIQVAAKSGDLYGMAFTNARTVIVPTDEMLLLRPLDFNVGGGTCTTQVMVDYTGKFPLLRLSGHVDDIDAYEVYNELLDRKSVLRGKLGGDFYLQGELGKPGFLATSYGSFNVRVSDGLLRQSPMLGNIFSLLNVSQLFKLKLPDVSTEGVPFTKMTGEMLIDRGIIHTEEIVVESDAINMTYVGKYDILRDNLDLVVVAKPLGTIDKVVSSLPVAGWILGGKERALITVQFQVTGPGENPTITAIPISAISKGILGIFQRTLGLPLKLVEDPAILWGQGGKN